ncbi:MAG: dienelactone hydrolase family protein [Gammaproteobacteria bacterium]|nr:dienelactone hydrolase family protein [Gammaproteobacteria bacterium]
MISGPRGDDIEIRADGATLYGALDVPDHAVGTVIFAHGSGSSRHSPRNRMVARHLREEGLGTLLFDLLTADEEAVDTVTRRLRFDIEFLAQRLGAVTDWLTEREDAVPPVGYFGSSTGAAAALAAAASRGPVVRAVVSRGGRPDLAGPALRHVEAATLLIVGGNDPQVLQLNEMALEQMRSQRELIVVPGASHLFEEPGTLEQVAEHARRWFLRHLSEPRRAAPA